jgi:hypothetical protein
LILLDQDAFSGVEHLESMIETAGLREEEKMEQAKQVVEQEIDFPFLSEKTGFPSWGLTLRGECRKFPTRILVGKRISPNRDFGE